jgi:hypothetical protein
MPINPEIAIGAALPDRTFSWTPSDVLLYHLGVGATTDLRYTLESDAGFQVLPSFGIVAPTFHASEPPPLDLPGCDINLAQVVHGAQSISVNAPIPAAGTATLSTHISDVWDKGKAAVIWQEGVATRRVRRRALDRAVLDLRKGEGGWGGTRRATASRDPRPHARCRHDVRRTS